ncbi:MAG: M56 family metallopeptidase [Chloroflexi bacterium]|nr:M56 family metallopeptidase [Chloroflexota bacterium]
MFTSGSLVRSVNIYMVENIVQTAVALGIILLLLRLLKLRDPACRRQFLLLPLIVPLLGPPIYYLFVPNRQEMPVLAIDKLLDVEEILFSLPYAQYVSLFIALGVMSVIALLLVKGAISLAVLSYLPRQYPSLMPGEYPRLDAILDPLVQKMKVVRPQVVVSDNLLGCGVIGLGRPYLLMHPALFDLSDLELESVLTHELAHIKRRDAWLQFALLTFRNVLFFNPFVHKLCRKIAREEEMACDQLALSLGQNPLPYAESLVKVWHLSGSERKGAFKVGVAAEGSLGLKERVLSVLNVNPSSTNRGGWLVAAAAGTLATSLFFLC